ncbi:MAG: GH3 auxin-responsive promoter family protein, partial [Lachnospiraceae bacterium]|nr:GH3 auxin-responsive promoter family protein [Lachnospiraceae bacterium]
MVNESNSKKGLEVLRMFREETEHPMELTTELLMKLLDDNKDTEYGRKYDFANIRSIEDYQK